MSPSADDLPEDVKRRLLVQVREQVGTGEYNRLVGALGEDGLLNAMLGRAETAAREARPARRARKAAATRPADVWLGALCVAVGYVLALLAASRGAGRLQPAHFALAVLLLFAFAPAVWAFAALLRYLLGAGLGPILNPPGSRPGRADPDGCAAVAVSLLVLAAGAAALVLLFC